MIQIHVDAVLAVRDGFTGRQIPGGTIRCAVDGVPCRPVSKPGGYLVFAGLDPGAHTLLLRCAYYRDETIHLSCGGAERTELVVTMKPAANYPFGGTVTRLTLRLTRGGAPMAGGRVWMAAMESLYEIRIAQDTVQPGDAQSRVFCRCQPEQLSLPRNFFLPDGGSSEIVRVEELSGDTAMLYGGFAFTHKRGRSLWPVQNYTAGTDGTIRAVFAKPVQLALFDPTGGAAAELELSAGENEAQFCMDAPTKAARAK